MGCKQYSIDNQIVMFSERDEDEGVPCLCTFPHNSKDDEGMVRIDKHTLYSLALLGATVQLIQIGNLDEKYVFIPDDLPDQIVAEIKRQVFGSESI